jgi:hypothetical protein
MEQLVNTQQAGKGIAGAVVISELWRLAVALCVCVYKCLINSCTNQTLHVVTPK